jgi:hypothetical protein
MFTTNLKINVFEKYVAKPSAFDGRAKDKPSTNCVATLTFDGFCIEEKAIAKLVDVLTDDIYSNDPVRITVEMEVTND